MKIRKSDFAKELGLSRPRISQLCRDGLPVDTDGFVDRTTALEWIRDHVLSADGGWAIRRDGQDTAQRASELLISDLIDSAHAGFDDDAIVVGRLLYERLRQGLLTLPDLLLRVDRRTAPLVPAAIEFADVFLGCLVLSIDSRLIADSQAPLPQPDYRTLFRAHGVACTGPKVRTWRKQADEFLEQITQTVSTPVRMVDRPEAGSKRRSGVRRIKTRRTQNAK